MKRRALLAGTLVTAGTSTMLPIAWAADERPTTTLAGPDTRGTVPLEQALLRRRSVREYAPRALSLAFVAQLLWAAQGTTASRDRRTAPSAGALYPLELHLVATRVDGLPPGAHRYRSGPHALQQTVVEPMASALAHAAMDQPAVGDAAAVLVIAAVEARTAAKYGARAARYLAFEAGAAAQNVALQATALGLASVVVGAFDDDAVAAALRLAPGGRPIVLLPIGHPR